MGNHEDNSRILKSDDGTSFRFTHSYLNNLGLKTTETKDPREVEAALLRGAVVITSVQGEKYAYGPTNTFTDRRHVMLITKINLDGTVDVNNPNRKGYNAYNNDASTYDLGFIDDHISMGYVIVEPNS